MEFRTIIKYLNGREKISHSHRIMLLGSCFSDNIGSRMHNAFMQVEINPFGTVYNPFSILNEIDRIISSQPISEEELFQANGMWNHFGFHSAFSHSKLEDSLMTMNNQLNAAHVYLAQSDIVIITLGTAFIYEHKASKLIVSNCHKLPANEFNRRLLDIDEVLSCLDKIVKKIIEYNPKVRIIFTISPIRHIADGLEQNQMSKSTLRVAVGKTVANHPKTCEYFPAYEIMMDDLRDYRFYASDMVHPSDVAVDYIWNKFKETYFDEKTSAVISRCKKTAKRLAHRPMTDNPEAIARFNNDTASIITGLITEYPYLQEHSLLKRFIAS